MIWHPVLLMVSDVIRMETYGQVQDGVATATTVYVSFAPDGTLIGKILLPEICANLCFGGVKRNRLFMMGSQSLYALYVEAQGSSLLLIHL